MVHFSTCIASSFSYVWVTAWNRLSLTQLVFQRNGKRFPRSERHATIIVMDEQLTDECTGNNAICHVFKPLPCRFFRLTPYAVHLKDCTIVRELHWMAQSWYGLGLLLYIMLLIYILQAESRGYGRGYIQPKL